MNRFLLAIILCSFIALNGCVTQHAYHKQTFAFDVQRTAQQAKKSYGVLEVRNFSIVSAFAGQGLVTRTSSTGFQSDFYNQFLVAPEYMITDITRIWMRDSGLFSAIVAADRVLKPDYILSATITKLYGDFTDPSTPKAVVEIHFTCVSLDNRQQSIIFDKTYLMESSVADQSANDLVLACSHSIADILTQLELDLPKSLIIR